MSNILNFAETCRFMNETITDATCIDIGENMSTVWEVDNTTKEQLERKIMFPVEIIESEYGFRIILAPDPLIDNPNNTIIDQTDWKRILRNLPYC